MERWFIDTNVFIYALDQGMENAVHILDNAVATDAAITSPITIMEYCSGGENNDVETISVLFKEFINDNYIRVYPISSETGYIAAKLRDSNPSLKAMDAIQLACAIENECSIFYTNDIRLKKIKIDNLEIKDLG